MEGSRKEDGRKMEGRWKRSRKNDFEQGRKAEGGIKKAKADKEGGRRIRKAEG